VESELAPHALDWERDEDFPNWVFKRMGDLGLLGLRYPTEVGGQGGDWGHAIVLAEEMARVGSAGVGMAVAVQSEMATPPIERFGTPEQKDRYLGPAIRGEKIACLGISEPDAGSDVAAIQTSARRDGDEWVINGRRIFITNGRRADFCVLVARTNKPAGYEGFSLFLVDTDLSGFHVSRTLDKLGTRSSDTAELVLDDVRVPSAALLGEEDKGFFQLMWELRGSGSSAPRGPWPGGGWPSTRPASTPWTDGRSADRSARSRCGVFGSPTCTPTSPRPARLPITPSGPWSPARTRPARSPWPNGSPASSAGGWPTRRSRSTAATGS
jgi:acyl-CoA dehydrogenase